MGLGLIPKKWQTCYLRCHSIKCFPYGPDKYASIHDQYAFATPTPVFRIVAGTDGRCLHITRPDGATESITQRGGVC